MSRRIARPYAAALFKVVEKQGATALREVERQLATVAEAFRLEPALLRTFELPSVTPARKQQLLLALGRALAVRVEVQRLLAALEQHYRLRFLPEVAESYGALVDRREGVVRGTVELPAQPSAEQLATLADALGRMLGARVELAAALRPELLAGFVVRVGSRVYDGSLRTQLERFAASGKEQ